MLLVQAALGPGFSRLSRCCFWWRIDNNYLATSLFVSRCVSCTHPPFFSVLLVTRPNLLPSFASPLSSCCDVPYAGGKCEHGEIMLVLYMCRYALGMRAFLCSSCCVSASEFLQRLSALSPLKLLLRGISSIVRLAGYIDVVGRSSPQWAL